MLFSQNSFQEIHQDVRIHCKNQIIISTSKFVLASSSKFLLSLFSSSCDCTEARTNTYDLICPSFESEAVAKVIELISGLEIPLTSKDFFLHQQIALILENLKIEITLPAPLDDVVVIDLEEDYSKDDLTDEVNGAEPLEEAAAIVECVSNEVANPKLFDCVYCSERFSTPFELDSHVNIHFAPSSSSRTSESIPRPKIEPLTNVLACPICNKIFSLRFSLDQHMKKHRSGTPVSLDQQTQVVNIEPDIVTSTDFVKAETLMEVQYLTVVNDELGSLQELNTSLQPETEADAESSQVVQAPEGPDVSQTDSSIIPEANKGNDKTYRCHICKCVRTTYFNILFHIGNAHFRDDLVKLHDKEKPMSCRFCSEEFGNVSNLNCHFIFSHEVLGKVVPKESQLRVRTVEVNDSEKDRNSSSCSNDSVSMKKCLTCPLCGIENFESRALLKHLAFEHFKEEIKAKYRHGDAQWQCTECREIFQDVDNLIHHLMSSHEALNKMITFVDSGRLIESETDAKADAEETGTSTACKILKCPECNEFVASTFTNLQFHLGQVHFWDQIKSQMMGNIANSCKFCNKSHTNRKSFIKHAMTIHDGLEWFLPLQKWKNLEELRSNKSFYNVPKKLNHFQCPMCKTHCYVQYEKLMSHLAIDHFSAKLLSDFDSCDTSCEECLNAFRAKSNDKLVEHLALKHSKLSASVPTAEKMMVTQDPTEGNNTKKAKLECRKCERLIVGYKKMIKHGQACFGEETTIGGSKEKVIGRFLIKCFWSNEVTIMGHN